MAEQNSNTENQQRRLDPDLLKKGLRCDLDQYEMLKRCSEKQDMTEWNQWRISNPSEDIWLQGGYFRRWTLKGAYFNSQDITGGTGTRLRISGKANLENAKFDLAYLERSFFNGALLRDAIFQSAHLEDTIFYHSDMRAANVKTAIVNSATSFWEIKVDRNTNFLGTALDSIRIDPATKQLLEYNIRRMNWENWYKQHPRLKWLVNPFWLMSDYGSSTGSVIFSFLMLAIIFAGIYYLCALINPPGIVNSLIEGKEGLVPDWLLPFRSIYFSIVTMTTLGFGDMHANCQSFWGHLLLTFQVLLGYVLLGALVTRFAVLFTAGGPAGKFADEQTEKKT